MKLFGQDKYLRIIFIVLLAIGIISYYRCKVQNIFPGSYTIIRNNYFDSNYYRMNQVDTNEVNMALYKSIFDKVPLDSSAKCLLIKIYSDNVVWEEYGLYDYKTGKYYYTSLENERLFFTEADTERSKEIYGKMQKYINDSGLLLRQVVDMNQTGKKKFDFGNFEVSRVKINNKKTILVESYYW